MDNAIEERYVFLRSCSADFSEAIKLLEDAESQEPRIAYALLRYAVIVYFRPFTKANTRFLHPQQKGSEQKSIRLRSSIIPFELLSFHHELKISRDSAYAHSDLEIRNPRLHYWRDHGMFPIAFSPVDKKPLHIHQHKIRELCEVGLEWVTRELRSMEQEFRLQYPDESPE